jgi:hypothetical protein
MTALTPTRSLVTMLALTLLLAGTARAQELDTVLLTNGGRMRGTIMEEDPQRGVSVRLPDGTVRKLEASEVKEVHYASGPAPTRPQGPAATAPVPPPVVTPPPPPAQRPPPPVGPPPAPPWESAPAQRPPQVRVAPAPPPPPPPPPAYYRPYESPDRHRHAGFYLHLDLGPSYTNSSGGGQSVYGWGGAFGGALGGAVAENFILAFHFWITGSSNPTVKQPGQSFGTVGDDSNNLVGIGPMFAYYLMPANIFLSVTPSFVKVSRRINGFEGSTKWGVGSRFSLGKEWWVSDHWGLGVIANFDLGYNQDQGLNPDVTTVAGSVGFSATLN